jgi:hypothetical protein
MTALTHSTNSAALASRDVIELTFCIHAMPDDSTALGWPLSKAVMMAPDLFASRHRLQSRRIPSEATVTAHVLRSVGTGTIRQADFSNIATLQR